MNERIEHCAFCMAIDRRLSYRGRFSIKISRYKFKREFARWPRISLLKFKLIARVFFFFLSFFFLSDSMRSCDKLVKKEGARANDEQRSLRNAATWNRLIDPHLARRKIKIISRYLISLDYRDTHAWHSNDARGFSILGSATFPIAESRLIPLRHFHQ